MMNNPQKNDLSLSDQLADFTDRILSEGSRDQDTPSFAPDPELHALELTAQRLKVAFECGELDEAVLRRMRNAILERWRRKVGKTPGYIWAALFRKQPATKRKWVSQQQRTRFSIVTSLAVLLVLLMAIIPTMNIPDASLFGASGQNPGIYTLIALGGMILLALWLFRRRP